MAMTQAKINADFEIGGRQLDSNQARVYLAMNTAAWVRGAHVTLDPFNQYDKTMLGKMADYIERITIIVGSCPFFATPDDNMNRKAIFPSRDDIVLTRSEQDMEKRKREEDSDESFLQPKMRTVDQNAPMMTSDTSTKNVSERIVVPGCNHATGIRRARSKEREALTSVSSLPAAATITSPLRWRPDRSQYHLSRQFRR